MEKPTACTSGVSVLTESFWLYICSPGPWEIYVFLKIFSYFLCINVLYITFQGKFVFRAESNNWVSKTSFLKYVFRHCVEFKYRQIVEEADLCFKYASGSERTLYLSEVIGL